jgi:hypothetical protein
MRGDKARGDGATVLCKFQISGYRGQANPKFQDPKTKYKKPNTKYQ